MLGGGTWEGRKQDTQVPNAALFYHTADEDYFKRSL